MMLHEMLEETDRPSSRIKTTMGTDEMESPRKTGKGANIAAILSFSSLWDKRTFV